MEVGCNTVTILSNENVQVTRRCECPGAAVCVRAGLQRRVLRERGERVRGGGRAVPARGPVRGPAGRILLRLR